MEGGAGHTVAPVGMTWHDLEPPTDDGDIVGTRITTQTATSKIEATKVPIDGPTPASQPASHRPTHPQPMIHSIAHPATHDSDEPATHLTILNHPLIHPPTHAPIHGPPIPSKAKET